MIDYYMIDSSFCVNKNNIIEILQKYIVVRNVFGIKKLLLYKEKEFSPTGEILKQKTTKCPILSIDSAINFLETINYKKI